MLWRGLEQLEPRVLLSSPTFVTPLLNQIVPTDGRFLAMGIDGFDEDGDALTITAVSNDANLVTFIPQGNRYALMHYTEADGTVIGDILVQLYEHLGDSGGQAAERFITLATNQVNPDGTLNPGGTPFYTDVNVHRVIPGFIIQSGDAVNGNGTGGSPLGSFNDVFAANLAFTGPGVLAMANSGANTNNSQWFITESNAQHLDGLHMIFGQVISGWETYYNLISRPTVPNTNGTVAAPIPVLKSVDIIQSPQDGVLMMRALPGWDGQASVTVTISDGVNSHSQVITVVSPAVMGNRPTLTGIAGDVYIPAGTTRVFNFTDDVNLGITVLTTASVNGVIAQQVGNAVMLTVPAAFDQSYEVRFVMQEANFETRSLTAGQLRSRSTVVKVVSQSPSAPPLLGRGTLPATAGSNSFASVVDGNLLYSASGAGGLQIFDISNPAVPILLDTFNTAGTARDLQVVNGVAYIADNNGGFISLDVSDPTDIKALDLTSANTSALGIFIEGNRAYVASGSAGVIVYDISNPADMIPIGTFLELVPGIPFNLAWDVIKKGDFLFVSDLTLGLFVLNVANPGNITLVRSFTNLRPAGLDLEGNTLYVADEIGLALFDVANPANPVGLFSLGLSNGPSHVKVSNGLAIVAVTGGFFFIDVTRPAQMAVLYTLGTSNIGALGVGGMPSISGTRITLPVSNSGVLIMEGNRFFDQTAGKGTRVVIEQGDGVLITVSINIAVPISYSLNAAGELARLEIGAATSPISPAAGANLTITTRGGDARIHNIIVNGAVITFVARTTDLLGSLIITDRLLTLTLDDLMPGSTITIAGNSLSFAEAVAMTFDEVQDVVITSNMHIKSLTASQWIDTGGTLDKITARSLGALTIKKGDFDAALTLSGLGVPAGALTLGNVRIKGVVGAAGKWMVTGAVGIIRAAGSNDDWEFEATGDVKAIDFGNGELKGTTIKGRTIERIRAKGGLSANIRTTDKNAREVAINLLDVGRIAADTTIIADKGVINTLKMVDWTGGELVADAAGKITTRALGDAAGDFGATMVLRGLGAGNTRPVLVSANIKGQITTDGKWMITGDAGTIKSAGTGEAWELEVAGLVKTIDSGAGDLGGVLLSAVAYGAIKSRGVLSANITATGSAGGVAIKSVVAGNVAANTVIRALAGAINTLKLVAWEDGELLADSIGTLRTSGGGFGADLTLGGVHVNGKPVLRNANIGGEVGDSTWRIVGDVGKIALGSTGGDFSADFRGQLNSFAVRGDFKGDLTAMGIKTFSTTGDVIGARVLVGANFGADGRIGGAGDDADTFAAGVLGRVNIGGAMFESLIAAGVVPVGDLFNDFDAAATIFTNADTPTDASIISNVVVRGAIDASSRFIAGRFVSANINGTRVSPGDPVSAFAENFRVNP